MGNGLLWLANLGDMLIDDVVRANLATALIFGGALLLDRACERKISASVRLALYGVCFLRVFLPVDVGSLLAWQAVGSIAVDFGAPTVVGTGAGDGTSAMAIPATAAAIYLVGLVALVTRWLLSLRRLARYVSQAAPASLPLVRERELLRAL